MRANILLSVALGLACVLVIVLGSQNRRLIADQDATYLAGLRPAVGTWLPTFDQTAIDGRLVRVGSPKRAQVLYFFDTTCPICRRSAPALRVLTHRLATEASEVELVGMGSGPGRSSYLQREQFGFPVVMRSPKATHLLKVRQVPLLVATDRDGRVLFSHVGEIDSKDDVTHLLAALHVTEDGNRPHKESRK